MATFLIHKPDDETQVIKLDKDKITLGRKDDNDIVIDDVFVSRNHAEVEKKIARYLIRDRKSRYGTFVNGERVTELELSYGDEIQIGNTIITFVDEKTLDYIPERKVITRKAGGMFDAEAAINALVSQVTRGEKKETIISALASIKQGFRQYQEKVGEIEKSREVVSTLCEVGKIINFVFDLNVLLNLLMDLALKIIHARRGFIMLYDPPTNQLQVRVARNMGSDREAGKSAGISRTIAQLAFEKTEVITTEDATKDERFRSQESVISYAIGYVICVPLLSKEKERLGVLYLDNPAGQNAFTSDDIQFMVSFANQSSIAIENAQLYDKIRQEERIRERLQRFFSPGVMNKIMAEEKGMMLVGEHRVVTIMFCDIRGYTSLTERIDVMVAVGILNDFLSSMTEAVFEEEGTLDKYIGDCVMAIFGAPVSHPDDPIRAVRAALAMKERVSRLKAQWREKLKIQDIEAFEIGIGIHTGEVIAGNIGNIKRMEYTVVSTAVNLASRLESIAEPRQIIISKETYDLVKDQVKAKKLMAVQLKNIKNSVVIYEVTGLLRPPDPAGK
ncbi:MAG TPA: adenylate/guanylate cyclase domain-containing protein [bacterium]